MPELDLTTARQVRDNLSTHKLLTGIIYTGPASYVAGGDPLAPSDVGWNSFDQVILGLAHNGSAVRLLVYDRTNETVLWYVPDTGSEVAGGQDLSGYTAQISLVGHG